MLAIAHAVAANAGLASILFSINYHFGGVLTGEDAVDSRARRRIGLWRQELIFGESSICRSQSGQFPVEYAWFGQGGGRIWWVSIGTDVERLVCKCPAKALPR